jgi:hypothetical protein
MRQQPTMPMRQQPTMPMRQQPTRSVRASLVWLGAVLGLVGMLGTLGLRSSSAGELPMVTGKLAVGTHTVKLEQGKTYQITATGEGFRPQIQLLGQVGLIEPEKQQPGTYRVFITPEKTQEYRLLVFIDPTAPIQAKDQFEYRLTFQEVKSVDGLLLNVRREWTEDDPLYTNGSAFKDFTLDLKKGYTYTIDLISRDAGVDPYLYLEDSNREVVAEDDDSGGGLNSRLSFAPSKDGKYRIIATTLNQTLGTFQLKVKAERQLMSIEDELTINDVPYRNGHYCKIIKLKLKARHIYTIDLVQREGGWDPYLYLENDKMEVLAQDDDSGGMLNARLRYVPKQTGEYRIIATTFAPDMVGGFRLTVREEPPEAD